MTKKKKEIFDDETVELLEKTAGFGIIGFAISQGFQIGLNYIRKSKGLPEASLDENLAMLTMESSGVIFGAVSKDPIVLGISSGRMVSHVAGELVSGIKTKLAKKNMGKNNDWNLKIHKIPDAVFLLPNGQKIYYTEAARKLREVVMSDTRHPELGWVPAGYKHPSTIFLAKKIIQENSGVNASNPVECAKVIQDWVRIHVPYCLDPSKGNDDYFMHPRIILESMNDEGRTICADCDCQTILVCSLLMALGHRPVAVVVSQIEGEDWTFNHILSAVLVPSWIEDVENYPHYPYYLIETTPNVKGSFPPGYDNMPKHTNLGLIEFISGTIQGANRQVMAVAEKRGDKDKLKKVKTFKA